MCPTSPTGEATDNIAFQDECISSNKTRAILKMMVFFQRSLPGLRNTHFCSINFFTIPADMLFRKYIFLGLIPLVSSETLRGLHFPVKPEVFSPLYQESDDSRAETHLHEDGLNQHISRLEELLPKLVSYELDKHGVLMKISVVLSLIILVFGATTVVGVFMCGCMEGVRRRRRIREWEKSRKGIASPRKYTQSLGEPDTDAETVMS